MTAYKAREGLAALIQACRPRQWTKNLLVFAAPLFAFSSQVDDWFSALGALVAYCLMSSSLYLLNDSLDLKEDRLHPNKCHRPIAAGVITVSQALVSSALLAISSVTIAGLVTPQLGAVILTYALIQVAYCFYLKQIPLLDIFCIASGFLLRAISGVIAAGLIFSPWFLLTVGLLALFLAIEKRKAELRLSQEIGVITRQVLTRYSLPLLLRLESIVSTSAFVSYSLWAAGPSLNGSSTSWMLLTVPFVLVGIFRYLLLSDPQEAQRRKEFNPNCTSEKPEEILFGDKGIKMVLIGWLAAVVCIGVLNK